MQELPRRPREVEAKSVEPLFMAFCIAFVDGSAEAVTQESRADADHMLTKKRILCPINKISFLQLIVNQLLLSDSYRLHGLTEACYLQQPEAAYKRHGRHLLVKVYTSVSGDKRTTNF